MTSISVPQWVAQLAADFLNEYANQLGNNSCNDYRVPDWVPREELLKLLDADHLINVDWAVVGALANALREP